MSKVEEQEVRRELAKQFSGKDWDGLCERQGEDRTVNAFWAGIDGMTVEAEARKIRKKYKRSWLRRLLRRQ